jgi:hypothetical protein
VGEVFKSLFSWLNKCPYACGWFSRNINDELAMGKFSTIVFNKII